MKLLILGAGQYGQLVKDEASDAYEIIDFLDDCSDNAIGMLSDFDKFDYDFYFVAIGNNAVRKEWCLKLLNSGKKLATIISKKSFVSPTAKLGEGCIVESMAVVNANSTIGIGTIISAGAIVNHNAKIGNYCHLDCDSLIGSNAVVSDLNKILYGQVVKKPESAPEGYDFDSGF